MVVFLCPLFVSFPLVFNLLRIREAWFVEIQRTVGEVPRICFGHLSSCKFGNSWISEFVDLQSPWKYLWNFTLNSHLRECHWIQFNFSLSRRQRRQPFQNICEWSYSSHLGFTILVYISSKRRLRYNASTWQFLMDHFWVSASHGSS